MRCAIWSPKDQRIDRALTVAGIKTFSFRKLTRGFYAALQFFFSANIIYQTLNTRHKCQSQYMAFFITILSLPLSTPLPLTEYVTWCYTRDICIGITLQELFRLSSTLHTSVTNFKNICEITFFYCFI